MYAPSVTASVASFELDPPDGTEMTARTWWSVTWLGVQMVPQLPVRPVDPTPLRVLLATPDGRAHVQGILEVRTERVPDPLP